MPEVTIISPWKDRVFPDQFKERSDMIAYAEKMGVPVTSTLKKPYSIDENLMHISYSRYAVFCFSGLTEATNLLPIAP